MSEVIGAKDEAAGEERPSVEEVLSAEEEGQDTSEDGVPFVEGVGPSAELEAVGGEEASSLTLLEVSPGLALVFGDVPEGKEITPLEDVPGLDSTAIADALAKMGTAVHTGANIAGGLQAAQGLYRLSPQDLARMKQGAQLIQTPQGLLGAMRIPGQAGIAKQARFLPATGQVAAAWADVALGMAMWAIEQQLVEISRLVQTNFQLTTDVLKHLQVKDAAELDAITTTINKAVEEVKKDGHVSETVWHKVASKEDSLHTRRAQIHKLMRQHSMQLRGGDVASQRTYLSSHAEEIVSQLQGQLLLLKAYGQYEWIRAMYAAQLSVEHPREKATSGRIAHELPATINEEFLKIREISASLTSELRVLADLPGFKEWPLGKTRQSQRRNRQMAEELLGAVEPLIGYLGLGLKKLNSPDLVILPEGESADLYLEALSHRLPEGEELRAIVRAEERSDKFGDRAASLVVDKLLPLGKKISALDSLTDSATIERIVTVTDSWILVAHPKALQNEGRIEETHELVELVQVREPARQENGSIHLDLTFLKEDVRWSFPATADPEAIKNLVDLLHCHVSIGRHKEIAAKDEHSQGIESSSGIVDRDRDETLSRGEDDAP